MRLRSMRLPCARLCWIRNRNRNRIRIRIVSSYGSSFVIRSFVPRIRWFGACFRAGLSSIDSVYSSVSIVRSFNRSIGRSFDRSIGRLFDRSIGRSFDGSVDRSFGRSIVCSFGRSIGRIVRTVVARELESFFVCSIRSIVR